MPLNAKGQKIKAAMEREYGSKKGDRVFYASENSGRIRGVKKAEDGATVAKLSAADRRAIPKRDFAVPSKAPGSGSYPIEDASHARNALARAAGKPVEAQVRAAVHKKYPNIGKAAEGATVMAKKTAPKPEVLKRSSSDRIAKGLGVTKAEDGFSAFADRIKKGIENSTPAQGIRGVKKQVVPAVKKQLSNSRGAKGIRRIKKLVGMQDGGVVEGAATGKVTLGSGDAMSGGGDMVSGMSVPAGSLRQPQSPAPQGSTMPMPPTRPMGMGPNGATPMSSGNMILSALQGMMNDSLTLRQLMGQQFGQMQNAVQAGQPVPIPQVPVAPAPAPQDWMPMFNQRWMAPAMPARYGV